MVLRLGENTGNWFVASQAMAVPSDSGSVVGVFSDIILAPKQSLGSVTQDSMRACSVGQRAFHCIMLA